MFRQVNTYVLRDRVCIISDAAFYDQSGNIIEFAPKVHGIASFTAAVTSLGLLAGTQIAIDVAEQYGSFDEFIAASGLRIERAFKRFLAAAGDDLRQSVSSIIVAGWSEREDRPRAFSMATDAKVAADGEPTFIWYEIDEWEHSPGLSLRQAWELHRAGMEPVADWDLSTFDPRINGLAVMQAQRRSRTAPKFWTGEATIASGAFAN
jgi:hypothetical protein